MSSTNSAPPSPSSDSDSVFNASPETTQERQQRLLSRLKDSLTRPEPETRQGLDKVVFFVAEADPESRTGGWLVRLPA